VPVTNLAEDINSSYIGMLGELITLTDASQFTSFQKKDGDPIHPTIPAAQWDTGWTTAQKNQMAMSQYSK
jgi:hypothetical protein